MRGRTGFLLLTLVVGLTIVPSEAAVAGGGDCALIDKWGGACEVPSSSGSINGDSVDVEANAGGSGGGGSGGGGGEASGPAPIVLVPVLGGEGDDVSLRGLTGRTGDGGALQCGPMVICDPFPTSVTLSDIASFRPTVPSQGMEPDGWMVVGLPTNFHARASAEITAGPLLGFDARVRFTPVRYRWDFGDGSGASSRTGGGTWAALGLAEFSETPTSHVYAGSGRYVIRLTVDYAAEYSFAGQAWRSISGTLAVPANELIATAGEAKTVLVARNCLQDPRGPGC